MKELSYCILAGGCFWCMAKPYYEYDGIKNVYSGYSGDKESNANYEKVKSQKTLHREVIKLEYDENIISYKEILDIYFDTIDPFDDGGQFIDRGNSYTTAIFYHSEEMKKVALDYINKIELQYNKKVAVKILKEMPFYMAEAYHQDYAIKNPILMQEELIESGRLKSVEIGSIVTVIVDRKLGSKHPHYPNLIYPVNYGYIKGLIGGDGEDQDAYIIGVEEAVDYYTGKVIAIIKRHNDIETKLVVCPIDKRYTREEIFNLVNFQEKYFDIEINVG